MRVKHEVSVPPTNTATPRRYCILANRTTGAVLRFELRQGRRNAPRRLGMAWLTQVAGADIGSRFDYFRSAPAASSSLARRRNARPIDLPLDIPRIQRWPASAQRLRHHAYPAKQGPAPSATWASGKSGTIAMTALISASTYFWHGSATIQFARGLLITLHRSLHCFYPFSEDSGPQPK